MGPGRWLDPKDTAEYLRVERDDLRRLVREGRIPAPSRQLGPRRLRWDRIELDAVMEKGKPASSGSDSIDAAIERMRARLAREKP